MFAGYKDNKLVCCGISKGDVHHKLTMMDYNFEDFEIVEKSTIEIFDQLLFAYEVKCRQLQQACDIILKTSNNPSEDIAKIYKGTEE